MVRSKIGTLSDFQPGRLYGVDVQGKKVLVTNLGGQLHAIDGVCSHRGGHLWEGKCPNHGYEYDLRTGKLVGGHFTLFGKARDVAAYPIVVEGNDVLIDLQ